MNERTKYFSKISGTTILTTSAILNIGEQNKRD